MQERKADAKGKRDETAEAEDKAERRDYADCICEDREVEARRTTGKRLFCIGKGRSHVDEFLYVGAVNFEDLPTDAAKFIIFMGFWGFGVRKIF